MAITLTESAAERVKTYVAAQPNAIGLRLGVRKTGCSGFAYVLDYAQTAAAEDVVFDSDGMSVVVDRDSLAMVDGTEIDFVREGLNQSFKFRNPNIKDECGCGESFSV